MPVESLLVGGFYGPPIAGLPAPYAPAMTEGCGGPGGIGGVTGWLGAAHASLTARNGRRRDGTAVRHAHVGNTDRIAWTAPHSAGKPRRSEEACDS